MVLDGVAKGKHVCNLQGSYKQVVLCATGIIRTFLCNSLLLILEEENVTKGASTVVIYIEFHFK